MEAKTCMDLPGLPRAGGLPLVIFFFTDLKTLKMAPLLQKLGGVDGVALAFEIIDQGDTDESI